MKLAIIGGAGVRTPAMISDLIRRHHEIPIDVLSVHDVSEERIETIGTIVQHLVRQRGGTFRVEFTTDIAQAVRDADFIYTAIRVGGEEGRTIDERVALKHGVLGQETTGPGGFAMALEPFPSCLNTRARHRTACAPCVGRQFHESRRSHYGSVAQAQS